MLYFYNLHARFMMIWEYDVNVKCFKCFIELKENQKMLLLKYNFIKILLLSLACFDTFFIDVLQTAYKTGHGL